MTMDDVPMPSLRAAEQVTSERLDRLRGTPLAFQIAARVALKLEIGSLLVTLPDGRALRFVGRRAGPEGVLFVRDFAFARRLLTGGGIGFAEAYLDGQCDSPDIATFLEVIARNIDALRDYFRGRPLTRLAQRLVHLLRPNTRRGSRRNIAAHYDLGNAFYTQWLDPGMTYSSARFSSPGEDLTHAQENKYRELAERIGLGPGRSVLEIGCGWGGFAEFAASRYGAQVTGITISREQFEFSRRRMFEQGLADRVDIQFKDYRDVEGAFDHVASIEMFEAVGEAYWPAFFGKLRETLRQGGTAGLQIITIADRHFEAYRRRADFIQRYVFPGGMLPSPGALKSETAKAGLDWRSAATFGLDYARTLAAWRDRFLRAWPRIEPQGFDERFKRLWTYYLAYCEAGFRAGTIDVTQIALRRV